MTLFLCDRAAAVRAALAESSGAPVWMCGDLDADPSWERILAPGTDPERCGREYRDCIARLSAVNAGHSWWANPVSEKNEHNGDCYRHLVWYAGIVERLRRGAPDRAVILAPAPVLLQLADYCRRNAIASSSRFTQGVGPRAAVLRRLKWAAILLWRRLWLLPRAAGISRRLPRAKSYALRTWITHAAAAALGEYRDPFLGVLHRYAKDRGYTPVVVAGILQDFRRTAAAALRRSDVLIVPEEYFLRARDILAAAFARPEPFQWGPLATFLGEEVGVILSWHALQGAGSAFLRNSLHRAISRRLNAELQPEVYAQTFENYAWEKLAIAGLREAGKPPFIVGFQHAFLCRDSFKYFPGPGEAALMPLPDRIVTLGAVTAEILRSRGEYPGVDIRTGVALRQDLTEVRPAAPTLPRRVLIPLSMSHAEIGRILDFLAGARGDFAGWKIALRFHPQLSWAVFSRSWGRGLPAGVEVSPARPLDEDLALSGGLAYTWSTVALEAHARGIPVIHLDILRPIRVDPLFAVTTLKYDAARPGDLTLALRQVDSLSDPERAESAAAAAVFIRRYFHPPTETNLDAFFPGTVQGESRRP